MFAPLVHGAFEADACACTHAACLYNLVLCYPRTLKQQSGSAQTAPRASFCSTDVLWTTSAPHGDEWILRPGTSSTQELPRRWQHHQGGGDEDDKRPGKVVDSRTKAWRSWWSHHRFHRLPECLLWRPHQRPDHPQGTVHAEGPRKRMPPGRVGRRIYQCWRLSVQRQKSKADGRPVIFVKRQTSKGCTNVSTASNGWLAGQTAESPRKWSALRTPPRRPTACSPWTESTSTSNQERSASMTGQELISEGLEEATLPQSGMRLSRMPEGMPSWDTNRFWTGWNVIHTTFSTLLGHRLPPTVVSFWIRSQNVCHLTLDAQEKNVTSNWEQVSLLDWCSCPTTLGTSGRPWMWPKRPLWRTMPGSFRCPNLLCWRWRIWKAKGEPSPLLQGWLGAVLPIDQSTTQDCFFDMVDFARNQWEDMFHDKDFDGKRFNFEEKATASDVPEFPKARGQQTTEGRQGLRRDFDPVARPEKGKGRGKGVWQATPYLPECSWVLALWPIWSPFIRVSKSPTAPGLELAVMAGVLTPLGRAGRLEQSRLEPAVLRMERSMANTGFFLVIQPGSSDTTGAPTWSSFRIGCPSDLLRRQGGVRRSGWSAAHQANVRWWDGRVRVLVDYL